MDSLYAFICLLKKGGISLNVTQIMAVAWGYNWCSNSSRVIFFIRSNNNCIHLGSSSSKKSSNFLSLEMKEVVIALPAMPS